MPLALPGDDVTPERFVCFRFDGEKGLYIHPHAWHEGVFALKGTLLNRSAPKLTAASASQMLAGVKQPQPFVAPWCPSARRRIAAPHEVIDVIDVVVPIDSRLGVATPTRVACLRLVLGRRLRVPVHHQIGSLRQRLDTQWKQPVEIHRA